MFGFSLQFASPWILAALITLPIIWWLLRLTPPRPQTEPFPPTQILADLTEREKTPAQSPWWLTLLRLLMAGLVIAAMAGPVINPQNFLSDTNAPVILVMDDGWASAQDWDNRKNTALGIVENARDRGLPVTLLSTTGRSGWTGSPITADEAIGLLEVAEATPLQPNHTQTGNQLSSIFQIQIAADIFFLSDGLQRSGSEPLLRAIAEFEGQKQLYVGDTSPLVLIETVSNSARKMSGTAVRANTATPSDIQIIARDKNGLEIAQTRAVFGTGESRTQFEFAEPVELRNQIARLEAKSNKSAAAVQLLDANNRRRLVGVLSGETLDQSQPLLSPLFYIERALEPFSDIRRANAFNTAEALADLINQRVSVIVLADIGTITEEPKRLLTDWIENGGMLIRFAGPRLGNEPDNSLLPVEIRPGDRNFGGALSWDQPKRLAPFAADSPFFGLEPPREVLVNKQILALQEVDLEEKTWATLEDGTPLVTADNRGSGWIVFFHVGSNAEWSNLPLSGTFVEMLRLVVNLSLSNAADTAINQTTILPALSVLNGKGELVSPEVSTKPLVLEPGRELEITSENPPGIYGTEDGILALNLFEEETSLTLLDLQNKPSSITEQEYTSEQEIEVRHWLLLVAAILMFLDSIAVLWMGGALRWISLRKATSQAGAITVFAAMLLLSMPSTTFAQGTNKDFESALKTRLAYVITGVDEIDRISEAGMVGLTRFLATRTSLEPGTPIGLDISTDELSFYSLIYWPIDPAAPLPDVATMNRIDAFMKQGGSVLFDTRDQLKGILGGTSGSPAARTLQTILSGLDIPPLEPVPEDHVLTKAFYLLDTFPGRFSGGDLWIEASRRTQADEGRPVRIGDGVSSILITSNDLAGAWAVDGALQPMFPTIPPDPAQRHYAFRVGVNLMMYVLTGNYKSDQVHLPALLERLGQ